MQIRSLWLCLLLVASGCGEPDPRDLSPSNPEDRGRAIYQCLQRGTELMGKSLTPALSLEERMEFLEEAESYLKHAVLISPGDCASCVWHLAEVYHIQGNTLFRLYDEGSPERRQAVQALQKASNQYEAYKAKHYPRGIRAGPELVYARLGKIYQTLGEFDLAKSNYREFLKVATRLSPERREEYNQFIEECDREQRLEEDDAEL